MRATVRIDRRQPAAVTVGTTGARCLANSGVESRLDGGPLERRQVVEVSQVGYVHDRRRYAPRVPPSGYRAYRPGLAVTLANDDARRAPITVASRHKAAAASTCQIA